MKKSYKDLQKQFTEALLYSNAFIALCAVAQAWLSFMLVGLPVHIPLLLHLFFSTILIYNFDRFIYPPDKYAPKNARDRWMLRHRAFIKLASFISIAGGIITAAFLKLEVIFILLFLGILAVAYSVPLFYFRQRLLPLKQFRGQKAFVIATVWAIACTALPLLSYDTPPAAGLLILLVIQRFFFITALAIQFDIRDVHADREAGIFTIPVIYGIAKTQWFAGICLVVAIALLYPLFAYYDMPYFSGMLFSCLCLGALLGYSKPEKPDTYYTLIVDGMMILQFFLVLAEKSF